MIERIKAFWLKLGDFAVYVLALPTVVMVAVFYLLEKKGSLEDELERTKAEGRLKESKHEQDDVDRTAAVSLSEYERVKREYLGGQGTDENK